jgi:hypothetical protein
MSEESSRAVRELVNRLDDLVQELRDVQYTPNEVQHFRTCPHGADLIVVRDISVDRGVQPYAATGGELLHIESYDAPAEDLQATGWYGRIVGWD